MVDPQAPSTTEVELKRAKSLVGSVISHRYRIDSIIAIGGMGTVYKGEHLHIRKRVAIKVLHVGAHNLPQLTERFKREAIVGANVSHPNIAAASDFGQLEDGSPFLVQEFIRGKTLYELIQSGPLPYERAVYIARQIADALHTLHQMGVVHRDLKPLNIMLIDPPDNTADAPYSPTPGRDVVKIIDFGTAQLNQHRMSLVSQPDLSDVPSSRITQQGQLFGTIAYMAPEAALGMEIVDSKYDLYALGVVMYQMFTGQHPFGQAQESAMLRMHLMDPIPPFSVKAPGNKIPPSLEQITLRLLDKAPDLRFEDGLSVVDALDLVVTPPFANQSLSSFPPPTRSSMAVPVSPEKPPNSGEQEGALSSKRNAIPPSATQVLGEEETGAQTESETDSLGAHSSTPITNTVDAENSTINLSTQQSTEAKNTEVKSKKRGSALAVFLVIAAALTLTTIWWAKQTHSIAQTNAAAAASQASSEPIETSAADVSSAEVPSGRLERKALDASWRQKIKFAIRDKDWPKATVLFVDNAPSDMDALVDPQLQTGFISLVTVSAQVPLKNVDQVFSVLEQDTGTQGLDLLYEIVQLRGGSRAAQRANDILRKPDVIAKASPILRLVYSFREANCIDKIQFLDQLIEKGDGRALVALDVARTGCGKSGAINDAYGKVYSRLRSESKNNPVLVPKVTTQKKTGKLIVLQPLGPVKK